MLPLRLHCLRGFYQKHFCLQTARLCKRSRLPSQFGSRRNSCQFINFLRNRTYSDLRDAVQWRNFCSYVPGRARPLRIPLVLGFALPSIFRNSSNEKREQILANIPKEVFITAKKKQAKKFLYIVWEAVSFWLRFIRVIATFASLFSLYPLVYVSASFTRIWWGMLLRTLEYTGPTFIKLGQWASTRRDLFSAEFCDFFGKLHDDSATHSWEMTKRKMKKAFGKNWKNIFVRLEKTPVGSGCIAQVHKGYMAADMVPDEALVGELLDLTDDDDNEEVDFAEGFEVPGFWSADNDEEDHDVIPEYRQTRRQRLLNFLLRRKYPENVVPEELQDTSEFDETLDKDDPPLIPVAVKVLHPRVGKRVRRDLQILRAITRSIEFICPSVKWISLNECMEEFAMLMTKQIDLRFEARCLEEFVDNFEDIPNVRFPKPIRPYCKRDVLVETFEEGDPISNFISNTEENNISLKEAIALSGVDALLQMVFVDNFVHGDLHPGNILVQNAQAFHENKDTGDKLLLVDMGDTVMVDVKPPENPLRLVLLDVGITHSLEPKDWRNLRQVFRAIVLGNGDEVAELMLRHARSNQCSDVEGFKRELSAIVAEARQATVSLNKIQVGRLLSSVFSTCSRHKVKMESNFLSTMLAIFVLEGLGRSLYPDLDILERAKPFILYS